MYHPHPQTVLPWLGGLVALTVGAALLPAAEPSPRAKANIEAMEKGLPQIEQAAEDCAKALQAFRDSKDPHVRDAVDAALLRIACVRSVRTIIATQPDYMAYHLGTRSLEQWQEGMEYFLACARAGKDAYQGMTSGVRACRSQTDGQILFYVFRLPKDYTPDRRYPVDVALHSGAALTWQAGWVDGKPSAAPVRANKEGRIWLSPCGRGNNSYAGMGEVAVVEALRDLKKHYAVDEDRVTIGGASMGGTGGFRLSVLHPELFAAAHSLTGGPAYSVPVNNGRFDALLLIDNLCNTGMCIWDAPREGHFGTNRLFADGLRERARTRPGCYPNLELTDPVGGHGVIDRKLQAEGWDWIRRQKRDPFPQRVVYKTYCLRYPGAYWAAIDMVLDAGAPARIEVVREDGGKVRVEVENVERFHLERVPDLIGAARELEVRVNGGAPLRVAGGKEAFFARTADGWQAASQRYPEGLVKKHGLSGPVQDVFMGGPVLMVHGKEHPAADKMIDAAVRRLFGPGDGAGILHTPFERRADRDVTAQDLADKHLVLFGTPRQNLLLRKMADRLPVRFLDDGVEVGGKSFRGEGVGVVMVYPNPLNPERYVLLLPEPFAGGSPLTYPDYLVVKTVSGPKGPYQQVLQQGNFDARWR